MDSEFELFGDEAESIGDVATVPPESPFDKAEIDDDDDEEEEEEVSSSS